MTSKDGMEINSRFFAAIEELKKSGAIRGLGTFTNMYGINRWNLIHVRDNPSNSTIKPEYIAYLADAFDVSLEWLLLGRGNMFKDKKHKEGEH